MPALHPRIDEITRRITERSRPTREAYLKRIDKARSADHGRARMGCANLAHAFAAMPLVAKLTMRGTAPNVGIVTAYNDMLSAHEPFGDYPPIIKDATPKHGGTA